MKYYMSLLLSAIMLCSFGQKKAVGAPSINEAVKTTFDAINSRNQKQFLTLVNKRVILDGLQVELDTDTSMEAEYGQLYRHPDKITKLARYYFRDITKALNKIPGRKNSALELIDHEITYTSEAGLNKTVYVDLTTKINDDIFHFGTYVFQSGKRYAMLLPFYELEEKDGYEF